MEFCKLARGICQNFPQKTVRLTNLGIPGLDVVHCNQGDLYSSISYYLLVIDYDRPTD